MTTLNLPKLNVAYLLVISKVVPKICARTNSAIVATLFPNEHSRAAVLAVVCLLFGDFEDGVPKQPAEGGKTILIMTIVLFYAVVQWGGSRLDS